MNTEKQTECPNGKTYGRNPRKRHNMKDVSRTRLPQGDPRGDFHVVSKCQWCDKTDEYDCIYA